MRLYWIRVGPKLITAVLIRRENVDTSGRKPCEDGDRGWSDASTSQGMPQQPPEGATRMGQILPQSLHWEPTLPTPWLWTSGLQKLRRINFCSLKPFSLWEHITLSLRDIRKGSLCQTKESGLHTFEGHGATESFDVGLHKDQVCVLEIELWQEC